MLGGSGVDINRRLPENIEKLPPDYDLYPNLCDRAIGFLTRSCPFRCEFCIVPAKEGRPRQVSDLDTLLAGRRKLILLDDNILAHPKADDLLEEMASRKIQVNFTQTLDFRMLDRRKAALLRQIKCSNLRFTRCVYHFSLNNNKGIKQLARKYKMLMKSMETYYRWVSKRYAETFGRLHKNLVDTIFKYNNRARKGKYIATVAGTRKWSTA